MLQPNKVNAIYSLRDAAEHKAVAEMILRDEPSPAHREALLDARLELEAKTQDAIDACHTCELEHSGGNVIDVDFGREKDP